MSGLAAPAQAPELSISIVVYQPNLDLLRETLRSLRVALGVARTAGSISAAALTVVDNGSSDAAEVEALLPPWHEGATWLRAQLIRGHGNVGYGRGHDLAIERAAGTYHLVLNPDVVLDSSAILEAVRYLEAHPAIGLLTPHVTNATGGREWLCKRYPSVLVLALRGFAPAGMRRPFRRLLDRYEMRDLPDDEIATGIPIATGCFMFARRAPLQAIGGFSPDYFLYFEDFDLSLRLGRLAEIAYVPQVRIVHRGGYATRKGWAHRRLFLQSAVTFFRRHGWRLL
ncbi:MAG: glycosyltransferase family 2 protein [Gemmatimonadota bacterium]|nr:glycosyltransferase family 2 protein [Gemmatimonadota bacterium]